MRARVAPRLLEVEGVVFSRGAGDERFTVEVPSLRIHRGELVALTGRSGSGKSTILELLGLLSPPHRSERFLWRGDGQRTDIGHLWRRGAHSRLSQIRGTSMGFVLQTHGLLPFLTVAGNLGLIRRSLGLPPRDPALDTMIDQLDVRKLMNKKPKELSVGEQQRASIVRALAHRPALVLADEPTSALDPGFGDRVMGLFLEQAASHGIAVLIATHEIDRVDTMGLRNVCGRDLQPNVGYAWQFSGDHPCPKPPVPSADCAAAGDKGSDSPCAT